MKKILIIGNGNDAKKLHSCLSAAGRTQVKVEVLTLDEAVKERLFPEDIKSELFITIDYEASPYVGQHFIEDKRLGKGGRAMNKPKFRNQHYKKR